jgi:hypothetical protein
MTLLETHVPTPCPVLHATRRFTNVEFGWAGCSVWLCSVLKQGKESESGTDSTLLAVLPSKIHEIMAKMLGWEMINLGSSLLLVTTWYSGQVSLFCVCIMVNLN